VVVTSDVINRVNSGRESERGEWQWWRRDSGDF
jgi:hypothetical protein